MTMTTISQLRSNREQIPHGTHRPSVATANNNARHPEARSSEQAQQHAQDVLMRRDDILWDIGQGSWSESPDTRKTVEEAFANAMAQVYIDEILSHHKIEEADVRHQYELYKKELGLVEYDLSVITLRTASVALRVAQEFQTSRNFAQLAHKYSIDTLAGNGGHVGWISDGMLSHDARKMLVGMAAFQLSAPTTAPEGIHLMYFAASRRVTPSPMDVIRPELEDTIRAAQLGRHLIDVRKRRAGASARN